MECNCGCKISIEEPTNQVSILEAAAALRFVTRRFNELAIESQSNRDFVHADPIGEKFLDCTAARKLNEEVILMLEETQAILSKVGDPAAVDIERRKCIQAEFSALGLERLESIDRFLLRSWAIEELIARNQVGISILKNFELKSCSRKGFFSQTLGPVDFRI